MLGTAFEELQGSGVVAAFSQRATDVSEAADFNPRLHFLRQAVLVAFDR